MSSGADGKLVHINSSHGFDETVGHVTAAIERAGLTLLASIDHADGARKAGLTMPPTVVILYGNPRGGTPVMLSYPDAALELPLRVLIREDADGSTTVVFQPITDALSLAGVPEQVARKLSPGQDVVNQSLSPQS